MTLPVRDAKPDASAPVPIMRPLLPTAERLLPYLRQLDATRWYSNNGPLERQFRARVADHLDMPEAGVVTVSSGTMGLVVALMATGARSGGRCLMPSWTFAATPVAARLAGLVPHFADVRADDWALDAEAVPDRADLDDVAAFLPVAPFGTPLPVAPWERLAEATGIPVVIDAAACFDAVGQCPPARPQRQPVVISLHATKAFGLGEGGLILTRDLELAECCRRIANFGFAGARTAQLLGVNAKLSEYHAAVGLAALDGWSEQRAQWQRVTALYTEALGGCDGIALSPGYGDGWISSVLNVRCAPDAEALRARLDAHAIGWRRWWERGCHTMPAFAAAGRDPLPVTERLAGEVLGLPFSPDLDGATVDRVAAAVAG